MSVMRAVAAVASLVLVALPQAIGEEKGKDRPTDKRAEQRRSIDQMAEETLEQLFEESKKARGLFDEAVGYAVFSNYKFQFIFSGGGGQGVAVDKGSGRRTYMKMGTGGVGLGIGGKKYSIVFLFQDAKSLQSFIENGWQSDAQAGAAAGTADASAEATFKGGVRYYQLSQKGLIASADISGTRYWVSEKLNR